MSVMGCNSDTILYKHDAISISVAAGGQMNGVTTQCTQVFSMTGGGRIHAVSSCVEQDADILVLVRNKMVVFPLTEDQALWPAGMRQGTSVGTVAMNPATEAEGQCEGYTTPYIESLFQGNYQQLFQPQPTEIPSSTSLWG